MVALVVERAIALATKDASASGRAIAYWWDSISRRSARQIACGVTRSQIRAMVGAWLVTLSKVLAPKFLIPDQPGVCCAFDRDESGSAPAELKPR